MTVTQTHSGTLPRLRLLGGSTNSLSRHIKWFNYLTSTQFDIDFRLNFERPSQKRIIKTFGLEVIDRAIYASYTPEFYQRSYALRNSYEVTSDDSSKNANLVAYFDLDKRVAPTRDNKEGSPEAKLLPGYAYAAFFQNAAKFNSFIKQKAKPSRPFVDTIVKFMSEQLPQHALKMYEKTIVSKQPT